jgi:integrase/recombinase XerD
MAKQSRRRVMREVGDPRNPQGLLVMMLRYLDYLRVRGCTASTLHGVEAYLRDFIGWCDFRSLERPHQVTRTILETYQRSLWYYRKKNGEPLSIYSQRCKLTPVRGFFKWMARNDLIPANPASELELPRPPRRLPKHVLSTEDVAAIMALPDISRPLGLRDRAILEVFYSTGMRRTELVNLQLEHVDVERGTVFVSQGKGRRDRFIPLGARAGLWVARYLKESRPQIVWNERDRTLFLSREGEPLSRSWLSAMVARYVSKAPINKRGGCHLFRHTMATLMLDGGADVRYIQAMLGHALLSTTAIYTHVAIRQLMAIHAATHPANAPNLTAAEKQAGGDEEVAELFAMLDAEAEEERGEDTAAAGDASQPV